MIKDSKKRQYETRELIHDDDYFTYVFKKTEKIVCAVFFVTRSITHTKQKDILIERTEHAALAVMDTIKDTLTVAPARRPEVVDRVREVLIGLESFLALLHAARFIPEDVLEAFRHEVHSVLRTLRDYVDVTGVPSPLELFSDTPSPEAKGRTRTHERVEGGATGRALREGRSVHSTHGVPTVAAPTPIGPSRREQILGIIRDTGEVAIKDISRTITDCSEKTIQRELTTLVSEGVLKKTGERRWSRYSLAS